MEKCIEFLLFLAKYYPGEQVNEINEIRATQLYEVFCEKRGGCRENYGDRVNRIKDEQTNRETVVKALDLCFGVMMQPYVQFNGDVPVNVSVSNAGGWIEARGRAESLYYSAIKAVRQKAG